MSTPLFDTPATPYVSNPVHGNASWYSENLLDFNALINPSDATQILIYSSGATSSDNTSLTMGLWTAPRATPYTWTLVGQILGGANARLGSVVYSGSTYYLFYTVFPSGAEASIYAATSADGVNFTSTGLILSGPGQGRDDGSWVSEPAMIQLADTSWVCIYAYRGGGLTLPGFRCATCAHPPTGTWTKAGSGDILTGGGLQYEFHQVFLLNGLYYLIYEAGGSVASNIPYKIFAATSTDPTTTFTTLHGGAALVSPSGTLGAWDRYHVATPGVILENHAPAHVSGAYRIFYSGAGDVLEPYYDNVWAAGAAVLAETGPVTTFIFDSGSLHLQGQATAVDWLNDTIKVRLVDNGVTPAITDASMSGYTAIGTDATLASKSVVNDTTNHRTVFLAADATIASPGTGNTYGSAVVYKFITNDAGSLPLFCGALTPATTDGTSLTIRWSTTTGCGFTQQ